MAVIADVVIAAQFGDRNAGLMLRQNQDDLLFRKKTALLLWSSSWSKANFKLD
jgi:hypothetical protein